MTIIIDLLNFELKDIKIGNLSNEVPIANCNFSKCFLKTIIECGILLIKIIISTVSTIFETINSIMENNYSIHIVISVNTFSYILI